MRCTRSEHTGMPHCEPLNLFKVQSLYLISCLFGEWICWKYSQRPYISANSVWWENLQEKDRYHFNHKPYPKFWQRFGPIQRYSDTINGKVLDPFWTHLLCASAGRDGHLLYVVLCWSLDFHLKTIPANHWVNFKRETHFSKTNSYVKCSIAIKVQRFVLCKHKNSHNTAMWTFFRISTFYRWFLQA